MENLAGIGIQPMYLVPYVLLMVILYVSVFGRASRSSQAASAQNDYQLMAALSRGLNTIWLCIALMLAITGPCSSALCTFTSVSHTARGCNGGHTHVIRLPR